jgi:hypothetical protein
LVPSPSLVSPAVCRFASPPVVFQRSRQPPPTTDVAHRKAANPGGVSHSRQVALRRSPADSGCPTQAGGAKLPASP